MVTNARKFFRMCLAPVLIVCASCSLLNAPKDWSYDHPPTLNSDIAVPVGGVWCNKLESAKFMASTGWFAPDCSSGPVEQSQATVDEVLPFSINGVSMLIIRASSGTITYWIPLPDHNWI